MLPNIAKQLYPEMLNLQVVQDFIARQQLPDNIYGSEVQLESSLSNILNFYEDYFSSMYDENMLAEFMYFLRKKLISQLLPEFNKELIQLLKAQYF